MPPLALSPRCLSPSLSTHSSPLIRCLPPSSLSLVVSALLSLPSLPLSLSPPLSLVVFISLPPSSSLSRLAFFLYSLPLSPLTLSSYSLLLTLSLSRCLSDSGLSSGCGCLSLWLPLSLVASLCMCVLLFISLFLLWSHSLPPPSLSLLLLPLFLSFLSNASLVYLVASLSLSPSRCIAHIAALSASPSLA